MSIYIGNLSYDVTREDIFEVLAEYGTVKNVHLPTDRETGRPRGFAFAEMATAAEAAAVIEALDGAEWMGRAIEVSIAGSTSRRISRSNSLGGESSSDSNPSHSSGSSISNYSSGNSQSITKNNNTLRSDGSHLEGYFSGPSTHREIDCRIVLDGELEEVSIQDLEILVHQLRKFSGDKSIEILGIEKGSIVLKLSGSEEGFKVLLELWKTGQLQTLIGLPIEGVFLEIDSIEGLDSLTNESLKDNRSGKIIPREASVTNVNVFNRSTVHQSTQTSLSDSEQKANMNEQYTNNFQDSNIANMANAVKDHGRQQANQNIYTTEQDSLIIESVNEVKKILKRLEEREPKASNLVKIQYLDEETPHKFRHRLVKALTDGGEAAIEELFDNSYVNIAKAAIKGWMQP